MSDYQPFALDLRDQRIDTLDDFWDLIEDPFDLPAWFGRNLNAWHDTLNNGGISPHLDYVSPLTVLVAPTGLFAPSNQDGQNIAEIFGREPEREAFLIVRPPGV